MITITEKELEKLKPLKDRKNGNYGTCFLYEDNFILKAYTNTLTYQYNKKHIKRNIKNSLGVIVDDVSFPIDIAKVRGFEFAYIMPIITGISFDKLLGKILYSDFDITFDEFICFYKDALKKADKIASLGIEMNDFHKDNCKFKSDFTVGIFDVDFYESKILFNSTTEKFLMHYNLLEVNDAFYNMLKSIYNKKLSFCKNKEDICDLKKLNEIIINIPKKQKNYVDDVLTEVNDKLKKETIKDLIIR